MKSISEAMLDEVGARLEARLEALARTPGAYVGNVACFATAQERKRMERQGEDGNVTFVGRRARP